MPEFKVRWEIEVHAETARGAAQKALEIQRDPWSSATVFDVTSRKDPGWTRVDLEEPPNGQETCEVDGVVYEARPGVGCTGCAGKGGGELCAELGDCITNEVIWVKKV
jgi:hypothetical protein